MKAGEEGNEDFKNLKFEVSEDDEEVFEISGLP